MNKMFDDMSKLYHKAVDAQMFNSRVEAEIMSDLFLAYADPGFASPVS
jgi:hypothetical protein